MKLTTSKGNEYIVHFVDCATITSGNVMIKMHDVRRLPVIAEEFDGLECLKRESEDQGNKEFIGYTELHSISRAADGMVLIALCKE